LAAAWWFYLGKIINEPIGDVGLPIKTEEDVKYIFEAFFPEEYLIDGHVPKIIEGMENDLIKGRIGFDLFDNDVAQTLKSVSLESVIGVPNGGTLEDTRVIETF
jgi:hypothetical protein